MIAKLYCIGLGPGGPDHCTPAATRAILSSDIIVGYKTYIDLIPHLLTGKRILSSGMKREIDRCREAIEEAAKGATVSLISSGDSGIYGMAGLVLELLEDRQDIEVEVVPGVSAVQAAASRLGAPLMHDFAVISLSDLMTPWSLIRSRLDAAGRADFVTALYNPKSKGRTTQIVEAQEILLRYRSPETPVGIVRNACREGESVTYTTLGQMEQEEIDMLSLVMIGNSCTRIEGGRMLTPRGYSEKYLKAAEETQAGPARALFVGGTGSDVGKSVLTAGLCRLLLRRGYDVAPFKAQNMALNSAVTFDGGEIGRAQALQAAACGLAPHTDMNPVLLKPNSETGSQVIIQGKVVANMEVRQYHAYKDEAFAFVEQSFGRLSARHELVVMEGAGSIAEVNLRETDITNLRAAAMAKAPVILVADIDRGGVFAQVVGTLELLTPTERAQIKGIVINKFRGEKALLDSGIALIEDRTGVPVLGVLPWLPLDLPEEDSLALEKKKKVPRADASVRIGVLRLPRISNYSDFDALERWPEVGLCYVERPHELEGLDLLILPGSKSTLSDLAHLRENGLFDAILQFHQAGGRILGICGGYQMLGRLILDPESMESGIPRMDGLGLLDVETVLESGKQTHLCEAETLAGADAAGFGAIPSIKGYEIHLGHTTLGAQARPMFRIRRRGAADVEIEDGALCAEGRVWGSYLHGLFDGQDFCRALLAPIFEGKGLELPQPAKGSELETELDRLADHMETHLNLEPILRLLTAAAARA